VLAANDDPPPSGGALSYEGPLPVYVGVGVRVQLSFKSLESNVNVGSLSALGAEAVAGHVTGSLGI
jgi:hypothetical protein